MLWKHAVSLAIVWLFLAKAALAIPAGSDIDLEVDVVAQTTGGITHTGCQTRITVQGFLKRQWWLSIVETPPIDEDGQAEKFEPIRCGEGLFDSHSPNSVTEPAYPDFIADVSTVMRFNKAMLDERILVVTTQVSLRQRSDSNNQENPHYKVSELSRELYFPQAGSAFIPLLVSSPGESPDSKTGEVFLRLSASIASDKRAGTYGMVLVGSGNKEARIFLDGGLAGKTSGGKQTTLRNVSVGMREVSARDAEGNEVRKAVRVMANRTVLVELNFPDPQAVAVSDRLVLLGVNEQGYQEFRRGIDSAVVVKIPAGEFLMGNRDTERMPLEHQVWVSDFLMDKTGVTWGQYKKFAAATGYPLPSSEPYWGFPDDHPAVYVTWVEARNYCEWAGGRLPTEAEREKGARGTDGRKFPWGNGEPEPRLGVFRRSWGYEGTMAVGTHPDGASPYGLLDMGGNVWEWCSDWYDNGYYATSPYQNPKGPPSGISHVVRGGSWDSRPDVLSASCRSWGHRGYSEGDFGFRCVMNVPR
jgi:sulfatase modifying factor 1